ncbi:MAG: radical SAM protein [Bacillota bacterium]|nr:radical SAM protein [Bacillota bacterium]
MKKVVLIEPQSKEDHVYKHVRMPRLGLPILGTQLKDAGYQVSIYLGKGESLPWPEIFDADLIGISTTTATCREAYRIAGVLQTKGIPVIIGGIHATFEPEEAIHFADYVVTAEAEYSFLPLVRSIEAGSLPVDIPGVAYWENGSPVYNPPSCEAVNMDSVPIPDLSLLNCFSSLRSIPVMTSRGCPFNCTFCCVTQMFGRRYRFRSTESVLTELALYSGRPIFFCDDNFTADLKRSKELLREIIDRGIKLKSWGAQVRADAARDEELLDLMRRSGCGIVYIGFESINPETLKSYNKQQTVDDIEWAINRFHAHGIRIHGMFVFGGDGDTADTIRETTNYALKAHIDSIQFMILTPLPGTPFYKKLEEEGRILTGDWSLYDGHHAVYKPVLLSALDLQLETIKAMKKFYSLRYIFQNVRRTGWASALYRGIGWGLTRHFDFRNHWYYSFLERLQETEPRPETLFYRLLKVPETEQNKIGEKLLPLRISLVEQKGVIYLKLRGLVGNLHLKELKRSLKKNLPNHYSELVVNMEGLRFASEKTATLFWKQMEKLGDKARRMQIVIAAENQARKFIPANIKDRFKMPHIELLFNRR